MIMIIMAQINLRSMFTNFIVHNIYLIGMIHGAIVTGYMESAMEATTSMSTPPEQVDSLIQVHCSSI